MNSKKNDKRKAAILDKASQIHQHLRNYVPADAFGVPEAFLRAAEAVHRKDSESARKGADVLHNKPGGSREKQAAIKAAWASGKYTSRDICAEQECNALGMSFSAARKALRNTPNPT
jgi:hypothetical protein